MSAQPEILFFTSAGDHIDLRAREVLATYPLHEQTASGDELSRCQVLMTWPTRPKAELYSKLPCLRMIQTLSAGVDSLDFGALPDGVQLFSNAGAYTDTVAEHAWGLALGVAKGIQAGKKRMAPRHLRAKTLMVVGCGGIGSELARMAKASLAMKVIGISRSFKSPERFDERYGVEGLGREIGRADLVVNALPLTRSTRSIFDFELLMRAKETAILVNVGRGETVDQGSLLRWLRERPESRYATDVFWKRDGKEVFDSPAWELSNFGGTMHTASAQDHEAIALAQVAAAENVRLFLETGSAKNRVDLSEYVSSAPNPSSNPHTIK